MAAQKGNVMTKVRWTRKGTFVLATALAAGLASAARADLPKVLDLIPGDSEVVAGVKNLKDFDAKWKAMAGMFGADMGALGLAGELIALPGLNAEGSAAMAITGLQPPAEGGESARRMVMLLPVTDYKQFVTGLGTLSGEGIQQVEMKQELGGRTYFVKDLGGGYAAMAQSEAELSAFEGKPGNAAAHASVLGKVGKSISDSSSTIVFANIEKLRPMIEQGAAQFKQQAEMMAQMMGPQGDQLKGQMQMMQSAVEAFSRDATVGVLGLNFGEKGVSFDLGAQFKEGSPSANMFQSTGKSGEVIARVPTTPFYFAMAMDMSSKSMKDTFRQMVAATAQANAAADAVPASTMQLFAQQIDNMDSFGMVMGASPGGIAGGLLANTAYYAKASDPASLIGAYKKMSDDMNGKTLQGLTYKTTYAPAAAEVDGVKVDSWTMQMTVDPNNPAAMQMQQMQMMMFGMGGSPSGYIAQAGDALVMTMSQSTPLMSSALKAAKDGNGLGSDKLLQAAASELPEGRTFEGYVGVKSILDAVGGFMAMMGGGANFTTPAQLSPVAMGGTTSDGGLRLKTFVPSDVIKTVSDFAKSMQGGGEEMEEAPAEEGGKPPRF